MCFALNISVVNFDWLCGIFVLLCGIHFYVWKTSHGVDIFSRHVAIFITVCGNPIHYVWKPSQLGGMLNIWVENFIIYVENPIACGKP